MPPMHQPTMRPAAATPAATPSITVATTSYHQHEDDNTPDRMPMKQPVLTNDFHLDTFFNPVWMSGPHVFSFAKDGTVVRPETYAREPYPGYHAGRPQRFESVNASHFQKPWKNVAITEQDDMEFAAFQARMRAGAVGERGQYPPYAHAGTQSSRSRSSCTPSPMGSNALP